MFNDNIDQEAITEESNIKEEVIDSVESIEKVQEQIQEDGPFLCENLFDSCASNGEVFINEVILEDNVNEIIIEQNVNEITVDNTDSTVKESVLDNMLQV